MDDAGDDSETEAETVIDTGGTGSKEVEVLQRTEGLKDRGGGSAADLSGSKSEASTEDEWERVSENGKDK